MNTPELRSALGEAIGNFVRYKQALNRKYRTEAAALRLFDLYLYEHGIADWESVDNVLVDEFLKSRPRTRTRSYNHLLGVLKRFFDWAVVQRLTKRNPVSAKPRRETSKRIPYLFDLTDAKRLLDLVRTLSDRSRAPHRALVYETVFALLYGLGLRVGEAARLKLGDVDLAQDMLFIRETKFSKSRMVPLGPKLAERLRCYVEKRHGTTADPQLPLFSFTKRGCIHEGTISQTFHKLVPRLELHIPPGVAPPRVHDLRQHAESRIMPNLCPIERLEGLDACSDSA